MFVGSFQMLFKIKSLRRFQNKKCIIFKDSTNNQRVYNYAEVIEAIESLCEKFETLQLRSVGIAARFKEGQTPGSVCLLLAILNHDCHFCPMPEDEFSIALKECGAKFLVSDDRMMDGIESKMQAQLNIFDETYFLFSIETSFDDIHLPKNIIYTIGTSGSTGRPKMVHVPYDCIAPNILALSSRFEIDSDDVVYLGTPFTFDPFVVELCMAICCGAALLIVNTKQRFIPQKLIEMLWPPKEAPGLCAAAATVLQMTPSLFRCFGLDAIRDVILSDSSALKVLILGGEEFPKPAELRKWMRQDNILKKRIYNAYGITEISCWSTIYELQLSDLLPNKSRIPIGEPIDDVSLRIATTEETNEDDGELLLGSPSRKTYIQEEDDSAVSGKTNDILFRHTGDLVERDANGAIYYIGRLNNTFKRFGTRICFDALERKIEGLFCSNEVSKVICQWDSNKQKLICCIKCLRDTNKDIHESEMVMKRKIIGSLMSHEKPDEIVLIDTIPLNKHGKIDRKKLADMLFVSTDEAKTSKPVDMFKRFLVETLAFNIPNDHSFDVFTLKRQKLYSPPIAESFINLGGTSFQALSLATEIGKCFSNADDQRQLLEKFLNPSISISSIFEYLETCPLTTKSSPHQQPPNQSTIPPSFRKLHFVWRVDLMKCVDATPAFDLGQRYICIGSHAGILITVDAQNGKEVSRLKLLGRIECEVAFVSSDLALVGCNAGYLYALNFLNGKLYWSMKLGKKIKAKPLPIDDSYALIGCYDEDFNLLNICLKTQKIEWRKKVGGGKPIFSSPLRLDTKTTLVSTLDGTYARIDVQSGKALWTRQLATPIFSTSSVFESGVSFVIAEVGGKIHICSTENGDVLQSFSAEGNIFSNLTVYESSPTVIRVIFGCHDHHVYCLQFERYEDKRKSNLLLNWKAKMTSAVYATPMLAQFDKSYVIAWCTDGRISVLDEACGFTNNTKRLEGEIFSTPCSIRNENNEFRMYFGCRDNFMYCFQLD